MEREVDIAESIERISLVQQRTICGGECWLEITCWCRCIVVNQIAGYYLAIHPDLWRFEQLPGLWDLWYACPAEGRSNWRMRDWVAH